MRFVCIADTHNKHKQIRLPEGDVLIHAGDMTSVGRENELEDFDNWIGKQDFKHKIVVPGNHDWLFELDLDRACQIMTNCRVLCDNRMVIREGEEHFNLYGTPWQPRFFDWAFNLDRGGEDLKEKWMHIPDDTHILITHGPALGYLDKTMNGQHVGCYDLKERVLELKELKAHICGHIHIGYGTEMMDYGLLRINAAICNEGYKAENKPIVFDLEAPRAEPILINGEN